MSKRKLPTIKPSIWKAVGLKTSVNTETINPVRDAAPNFLVHQITKIKEVKARRSHRKGMCVTCQKIGEINMFRTPQSAAQVITAAKSRVVK